MNIETLLWLGGLLIEVLVVVAVVLVILLRRAQKARRQQPAEEANVQPAAAPVAAVAAIAETPPPVAAPVPAAAAPAQPAVAIEIASNDWIDGDKDNAIATAGEGADPAKSNESAERLRQQMDETNESLRALESDLKKDPTGAGAAHLATLKGNLKDMHAEIDSLQKSSVKLRQDMSTLRDKLRNSEVDMQTLQKEKEQLAQEYTALSMEYERVYANSAK